MLYREIAFIILLIPFLFIPLTAHGNETNSAQVTDETVQQETVRQSVRQTVTVTKFSPAVVEFLKRPLASQLVMLNPSGSPQVTIMWFKYEDGALLFTTTTDRVKFRNYQKDPRTALAILDPTNMYKWVIVNGTLSVDDRDPQAFYHNLAKHYLDETGLAEWRKRAVMERRTVLKLTPTRIKTMGFPQE